MIGDRIIRLRGDSPSLVWPDTAIADRVAWCAELRRLTPDGLLSETDPADVRRMVRQLGEWSIAMLTARSAAATAFAQAQGWAYSPNAYPTARLVADPRERRHRPATTWDFRDDVFEHPDWFVLKGRPVAAVVHLYHELAIDALPNAIVVDRLPASWYYPQLTTAYVFRRATAVSSHWRQGRRRDGAADR